MTAQTCTENIVTGRTYALNVAIACPDVDPSTLDFKRVGSFTTKSNDVQLNTTEFNTDTSPAGLSEFVASGASVGISGDLIRDFSDEQQNALEEGVWSNLGKGLKLYVQLVNPYSTLTIFCILTQWSETAATEDAVKIAVTFQASRSEFNATPYKKNSG